MTPLDLWPASLIALTAWTIAVPLMEGGMILNRYWLWLDGLQQRGLEWLANPLGLCAKCLSGQMALWYWVWRSWGQFEWTAVPAGVAFVCVSIFITYNLGRLKL